MSIQFKTSAEDGQTSLRHLSQFFIIIVSISVPFWVVGFLLRDTRLPLDIPVTDIFAAMAPLVAAAILTYRSSGWRGVKRLCARIGDVHKVKPAWWVVIFGLPLVIFGIIYASLQFLGYPIPTGATVSLLAVVTLAIFFYLGGVFEEVGYTGYATDPLERAFGPVRTALIIGTFWSLWHVPSMLVQGRAWPWIVWGVLGTLAFRFIYVWLYNSTGASLAAVICMHMIYNLGRALFPHAADSSALVLYPEVHYGAIIVLAIIFVGVMAMTRKPASAASSSTSF